MATNLLFYVNEVDASVSKVTNPSNYSLVDLPNDFLIWSGSLADHMTHVPIASELNAAASVIDALNPVTVARCLQMDYSAPGGYYTHLIMGMGQNARYVFCFSFDGPTATEPQLEAWDDATHTTANTNVLGLGTAINSFVKAVCTTVSLPGTNWSGAPIAGASNVLLLNAGAGALSTPGSGLSNDLYANIKIVIPANYSSPAAETFVFTVRYSFA